MGRAAFVTILLVLGASSPARAVSETAEGFSAAMQGCWNRADTDTDTSSQMCLDGGATGLLTGYDCLTHGDLTECSTQEGRYEFREERFWRSFDGVMESCDVFLEPRERVTLQNCILLDPPPGAEPMMDAIFERAI